MHDAGFSSKLRYPRLNHVGRLKSWHGSKRKEGSEVVRMRRTLPSGTLALIEYMGAVAPSSLSSAPIEIEKVSKVKYKDNCHK